MGCASSKINPPVYIPSQTILDTNMQQITITPQTNYSIPIPTAPAIDQNIYQQTYPQQTYPQQTYNQSQYNTPYMYQQQMYPQQIFPQYYYPQKTSISI